MMIYHKLYGQTVTFLTQAWVSQKPSRPALRHTCLASGILASSYTTCLPNKKHRKCIFFYQFYNIIIYFRYNGSFHEHHIVVLNEELISVMRHGHIRI